MALCLVNVMLLGRWGLDSDEMDKHVLSEYIIPV